MFTAPSISPLWSAAPPTAPSGNGRDTAGLVPRAAPPPPVRGIGLQHDLLVLRPAHELVRAGADRVLRDEGSVLAGVVLGWVHRRLAERHDGRERRPRLAGVHASRVGIDDLDVVDGTEVRRGTHLRVLDALQAELHGLRIELF